MNKAREIHHLVMKEKTPMWAKVVITIQIIMNMFLFAALTNT